MVKTISISDEVYKLSSMKNGRSFTEFIGALLKDAANKGDAKSILAFLDANEPLSGEAADKMTSKVEDSRKNEIYRKSPAFT